MQDNHDWSETVARYQSEMRRLYEKSELPPPAEPTPQAPAVQDELPPTVATEPQLIPEPQPAAEADSGAKNPEPTAVFVAAPPFGNEVDGTAQSEADSAAYTEPTADETDKGTLVVQLNSARGIIPIVGATVTVFRVTAEGDQLLYIGQTDENGSSPVWTLATKDRDLSLEPGVLVPYVNYAVQANAEGYVTFLNRGVSVFGGVKTVQRILMLPLPEPASAFEQSLLETRTENVPPELN